jgi:hypothetical protein
MQIRLFFPEPTNLSISLFIIASFLLLIAGRFFFEKSNSLKKTALFSAGALSFSIFAMLAEKGSHNILGSYPWLSVIIIFPIIEEIFRFLLIRLFEIEEAYESYLLGSLIGIIETLIILTNHAYLMLPFVIRLFITHPFHTAQTINLKNLQQSQTALKGLCLVILFHSIFNAGIFLSSVLGLAIALIALLLSIFSIILNQKN